MQIIKKVQMLPAAAENKAETTKGNCRQHRERFQGICSGGEGLGWEIIKQENYKKREYLSPDASHFQQTRTAKRKCNQASSHYNFLLEFLLLSHINLES